MRYFQIIIKNIIMIPMNTKIIKNIILIPLIPKRNDKIIPKLITRNKQIQIQINKLNGGLSRLFPF